MGDLGKSLMHAVGLSGNTPPPTNPGAVTPTNGGTISADNVLYGTGGFLPPPSGTAVKSTPMSFVDSLFQTDNNTPTDANSDAPAAAPFQPHKRTTLGLLADMLLSGFAHKAVTPFANKAYQENLSEAMQTYGKDPVQAIAMTNQFDPRLGMRLEAQYSDDKRADDIAARLKAAADDKYLSRAAAMYNTVTDDNSFSRVDSLTRRYLKAKGIDPDTAGLPTNADEAKTYAAGDIDPYKAARLDQYGDSLTLRGDNNDEKERHDRAMEAKATGKAAKPQPKTVYRNGQPLGVMSPDGTTLRLYDDGQKTWVQFKLKKPGDPNTRVFDTIITPSGQKKGQ